MPLRLMGLKIPVTLCFCCLCLLLRLAFNLYCRFMGIHERHEGRGLTFVYLKGYALLKCCCFAPCRLRERDRETCDQTSVHPLTPFESPPLADMEMLLVEHIIQTLLPPVCCRQRRPVHPLPCGSKFVCSGRLNTCSPNPMNMFTNGRSQVGVTGMRKLI